MNKTKIIILTAITLIVVGGMGGWVALSSSGSLIDVSETKTVEQDFSAIKIDTDNVGVEIQSTEKETATIEMIGQTHKSVSYGFDAKIEGGTLIVSANMGVPLSWINVYPNNLKMVISLPQKQYRSLQANGNSGMMYLANLQIDEIDCITKHSNITLEQIKANSVTVDGDAYVGLSDIQCDTVSVRTSASLDLERVEADEIMARAAAKITLSTNHLERQIDLESTNGSIQVKTVQAPQNVRFDVSSNGSINLFGGKYAGNINSETGDYLVRLVAVGSITVEEASK